MIFMSLSLGKILISSLKTEFLTISKKLSSSEISKTFEFFKFSIDLSKIDSS